VKKYSRTSQPTDDNIIRRGKKCDLHVRYLRQEYRHTLIIFNTDCFFTAAILTRTRLNVTFIRTLPVLLCNGSVPVSRTFDAYIPSCPFEQEIMVVFIFSVLKFMNNIALVTPLLILLLLLVLMPLVTILIPLLLLPPQLLTLLPLLILLLLLVLPQRQPPQVCPDISCIHLSMRTVTAVTLNSIDITTSSACMISV
jgi:hypothetical protein